MTTSFLSSEEMERLGLLAHPSALVSRKASLYGVSRIRIGANSRVDDFAVLSAGDGGITIGRHVHIGVGATLIGIGAISMEDFSTISGRVSVYSSSDDYSGLYMTNPTVPDQFRSVDTRPVRIERHVIVGAGSVILPGVTLFEGAAVGALSCVTSDVAPWTIVAGQPARLLRARSNQLLTREAAFLRDQC